MTHYGGQAVAGGHYIPDVPKAKAHRVSLRAVECPDCKADLGEPCRSSTGKVMNAGHRSRKRLATRLDNESRNSADLP